MRLALLVIICRQHIDMPPYAPPPPSGRMGAGPGQAPPPVKESLRLFEQRIEREQRAVRRRMETNVEQMFQEPPSRTIDPLWRHGGRRSAAEADASALPMPAAASMQCAGDDETERLRRTVPCLPCRC
jgi:hypothetical protein